MFDRHFGSHSFTDSPFPSLPLVPLLPFLFLPPPSLSPFFIPFAISWSVHLPSQSLLNRNNCLFIQRGEQTVLLSTSCISCWREIVPFLATYFCERMHFSSVTSIGNKPHLLTTTYLLCLAPSLSSSMHLTPPSFSHTPPQDSPSCQPDQQGQPSSECGSH